MSPRVLIVDDDEELLLGIQRRLHRVFDVQTASRQVVVEQHRGQLDFTSEVGKGTTFFVRLPLRQHQGD